MKIEAESNGSTVDIYICEKDSEELPDHGMYYAITGNGYYAHWDNGIVKGLVPCAKEELEPYLKTFKEAQVNYTLPPIDFIKFYEVLSFLRESYVKHGSESCVLLFYKVPTSGLILKQEVDKLKNLLNDFPKDKSVWNEDQVKQYVEQAAVVKEKTKAHNTIQDKLSNIDIDHSKSEYVLVYPKQKVSSSSVNYGEDRTGVTIEETLQEFKSKDVQVNGESGYLYLRVGSIHSHPHFNAYHSGIDDSDEMDWPGIHLTIGQIMRDNFEISASIVLQETRNSVDPCSIINGISKIPFSESKVKPTTSFFFKQEKPKELYFLSESEEAQISEEVKKRIKRKVVKVVKQKVSKTNFFGTGATVTYLGNLNTIQRSERYKGYYENPDKN